MFLPYSGSAEHEANSYKPLWSLIVYLAEGLSLPQVYAVYDISNIVLVLWDVLLLETRDLMLILFWYKLEVALLK